MSKRVVEEDLGESWEMYKKALGTDDAEPDGQGFRLPVPGEGEQISPSPTPEEEPSAKNHSKKSRRKSVSKKVSVPMEKCDARLTVLFPDVKIQRFSAVINGTAVISDLRLLVLEKRKTYALFL